MRGSAGPWLVDEWMDLLLETTPYMALHTGTPSADDPTATEVVGAWYARKVFTWNPQDGSSATNTAKVTWASPPNITLAGVAVYTGITGSELMLWVPYAQPLVVKAGTPITVGADDLYVEIG